MINNMEEGHPMHERRRKETHLIQTPLWAVTLAIGCILYGGSLYIGVVKKQAYLEGEINGIKDANNQRRILLEGMRADIRLNANQIDDLRKAFALLTGLKTSTVTLKSVTLPLDK